MSSLHELSHFNVLEFLMKKIFFNSFQLTLASQKKKYAGMFSENCSLLSFNFLLQRSNSLI